MAIEVAHDVEVVKKLTPDDILRMVESGELNPKLNFELDDGELIEVPPAFGDHSRTSLDFATAFNLLAKRTGGVAFDSNAGFLVGATGKQLRAPDAAYISPAGAQPSYPKWIEGAPDVAVEVLSQDQHTERYARGMLAGVFRSRRADCMAGRSRQEGNPGLQAQLGRIHHLPPRGRAHAGGSRRRLQPESLGHLSLAGIDLERGGDVLFAIAALDSFGEERRRCLEQGHELTQLGGAFGDEPAVFG